MEWIPVFSLIVLVATIGTFIMSVSAYIMFKIRESRRRVAPARRAPRVEAEVVAPKSPPATRAMPTARPDTAREPAPKFVQYTQQGHTQPQQPPHEQPTAWR